MDGRKIFRQTDGQFFSNRRTEIVRTGNLFSDRQTIFFQTGGRFSDRRTNKFFFLTGGRKIFGRTTFFQQTKSVFPMGGSKIFGRTVFFPTDRRNLFRRTDVRQTDGQNFFSEGQTEKFWDKVAQCLGYPRPYPRP